MHCQGRSRPDHIVCPYSMTIEPAPNSEGASFRYYFVYIVDVGFDPGRTTYDRGNMIG